jgi:hypothetical protein
VCYGLQTCIGLQTQSLESVPSRADPGGGGFGCKKTQDHFTNLVDILERQIKQKAKHETMAPSVQAILSHAIETERIRCSTEASLADRLFQIQGKIVGHINDMQGLSDEI